MFDPATKKWSQVSLVNPRADHTATLLPDGAVLLAGGHNGTTTLGSLQIFDPATNAFTDAADLAGPRRQHTATVLDDGRVLLIGGRNDSSILATTEYWNQTTDEVATGPTLAEARYAHTATRIPKVDVAVVGGTGAAGALATVEVYWYSDGAFHAADPLALARTGHAAVVLPDNGHLMILGGLINGSATDAVDLMHPYSRTFETLAELDQRRTEFPAAIVGPSVVVAGGKSQSGTALGSLTTVPFATLTSDFGTYLPNTTVKLTGEFWKPGEDVSIAIVTTDSVTTLSVVADAGGRFFYPDFPTGDNAGKSFFVTAVGAQSHKRAALDFKVLIPAPAGGLTLDPSQITQTANSVPLMILGGFDPGPTLVSRTFRCRDRWLGICVTTLVTDEYVEIRRVRVQGARTDTNIDLLLVPTTITASRIDVLLPPSVTSNPDTYGVAVQQSNLRVETCQAIGFIPCGTDFSSYDADGAFLGTLVVTPDATPPSIIPLIDGSPNASGWYTGDVSLDWSVTDPESAISSTTGCSSVAAVDDTAGWTFTCTATSSGGTSTRSVTIKRDATPPAATLSVITGTLGSNGWYIHPVTVRTKGFDDVSTPVTCTADQAHSTDTAGVQFSGSCTNAATLTTAAAPLTIKLDQTAPTIAAVAEPAASGAGWHQGDVSIAFTCADTLSGIATCPANQTLTADGSSTPGVATDLAGNTSADSNVVTVKIDRTAPTITAAPQPAPSATGWHQGNVTIAFTCADTLSGIASCPASQVLTVDGVSTPQFAKDAAGNTSAPSNVVTVRIDRTSPVVAFSGGPVDGSSYNFGEVPPAPACAGSDGLSGLVSCIISGYGTAAGSHTVRATATDGAGNVSVAAATYTVLPWIFTGFYQPVDMGGVVNSVKGGSTVPIAFEVFAGARELVDTAVVIQPLRATQSVCGSAETSDIELLATGATSLRYDAAAGHFVYNWKTPKMAGYCYVVTVTLQDGTSQSAQFRLK